MRSAKQVQVRHARFEGALVVVASLAAGCDGVQAVRCEGLCVSDAAGDARRDATSEAALDVTGNVTDASADAAGDLSDASVDAATAPATDATRATDAAVSSRIVVSAAWLADALSRDAALQVVDVRDYASYLGGHVPRAIYFDASTLSATVDGVSSEVVDGATVATLLGRAGLRSGVTTVVYGDSTATAPARMVWTLHHYGNDDARLLDGGIAAWRAEGRSTDTAAPPTVSATYAVSAGRSNIDGPTLASRLGAAGLYLVDARAPSEFAAGHIPGARDVDWASTVTNGAFRSDAELLALFAGIPTDAAVVAYCQSGARSSVVWVALRNLGFSRAILYDGSWSEWSQRGWPREP